MIKSEGTLSSRINVPFLSTQIDFASISDEELVPLVVDDDELFGVVLLQGREDAGFQCCIICYDCSYVGEDVVYCRRV